MSRRRTKRLISMHKRKFKHVVDSSTIGANLGLGNNSALIIQGVDNPDTTVSTDVKSGNSVKALFIELNVAENNAGSVNVLDWYLIYNPQDSLAFPNPTAVGGSTAKSYIFKQGMEMIVGGAMPTIKKIGVVKIPPKYRKFGRGDKLYIVYRMRVAVGATESFCFKSVFKEIEA